MLCYWVEDSQGLMRLMNGFIEKLSEAASLRSEVALQRFFNEKLFWKYAANLQENTHAEVWFH